MQKYEKITAFTYRQNKNMISFFNLIAFKSHLNINLQMQK